MAGLALWAPANREGSSETYAFDREAQHMTMGCSPHLRHWAPIKRLYGSMVCQHLKAQTTSALERKNNSAWICDCAWGHMHLSTCFFFLHTELNGALVQDQWTNYSATFCLIISLRVTEAEQEFSCAAQEDRQPFWGGTNKTNIGYFVGDTEDRVFYLQFKRELDWFSYSWEYSSACENKLYNVFSGSGGKSEKKALIISSWLIWLRDHRCLTESAHHKLGARRLKDVHISQAGSV